MTTLRKGRIGYPERTSSRVEPIMLEPELPVDMAYQETHIRAIIHPLNFHLGAGILAGNSDVFVSSATMIYYDPDDMNARLCPDCTVAFGVDVSYINERDGYVIWEMGKPPDFVLEVGSPTTADLDLGHKRRIYERRMGVPEYWRFDRSGGNLYRQALAGDRLVNGVYQPIDITTEPDGVIWGYSEMLGLSLCYVPDAAPERMPYDRAMLLFFDRETGRYLMTDEEEHAAYLETQAQLEESQARLDAERARVRELEEELHRRDSGLGPQGG